MESLSITSILHLQDLFGIFPHFGDFWSVEIIFNFSKVQKKKQKTPGKNDFEQKVGINIKVMTK